MIRPSSVVYIVILLALAGAYYYLNNRGQPAGDVLPASEPAEQTTYLFDAENGVPTSVRVQSKSGEIVEVTRGADNAWALTLPVEAAAEQGASEAVASQVTTMRVLDTIPEVVDPEIVGLKTPEYRLTVRFNNGVERSINIGVVTPTESGYYVQDVSGGEVVIVSRSAVDAILGLLEAPPYLEPPATLETGPPTDETVIPQP
jgi:hypothetical protein